jgi:hypothetical protein
VFSRLKPPGPLACALAALAALILTAPARPAGNGSRLLYFEAQAVAGYSTAAKEIVYRSAGRDDMMQKTSEGIDYVQKFSSEGGDWGTLALESRLAWDPGSRAQLQPQLYNGYFKARTPLGYFWAGHNRIAMGLESYFDTHAALLQTLQMYGAGFDRDWGAGYSRDFDWGDAAFSLTAGSGMPLFLNGNYLAAARICEGALARDNYNTSLYAAAGRIPDITGYHINDRQPREYSVFGSDFAVLWDRYELRGDLRVGQRGGESIYAVLGRFGVNLLEENRLKLEVQGVGTRTEAGGDYFLGTGLAYSLTADLAFRSMLEYEKLGADKRLITQLYYYIGI